MRRSCTFYDVIYAILLALWVWTSGEVRADVFELANGGRIEGRPLEDKSPTRRS